MMRREGWLDCAEAPKRRRRRLFQKNVNALTDLEGHAFCAAHILTHFFICPIRGAQPIRWRAARRRVGKPGQMEHTHSRETRVRREEIRPCATAGSVWSVGWIRRRGNSTERRKGLS